MFITVEEMYALKASYEKAIIELEMKKSVVDEFIAIAEAKELPKVDEEEVAYGNELLI